MKRQNKYPGSNRPFTTGPGVICILRVQMPFQGASRKAVNAEKHMVTIFLPPPHHLGLCVQILIILGCIAVQM